MDWDALQKQLQEWAYALPEAKTPLAPNSVEIWEAWWEELYSIERQSRAEVDAAAHILAKEEPLPALSTAATAFLELRLHWAAALAGSFAGSDNSRKSIFAPIPWAELSRSQIVEWFLIDAWHQLGCDLWMPIGYWDFDWWQWDNPRRPDPPHGSDHFAT